jgi:pimeloyl-ACP methyl ester carboxylesterase
MFFGLHPLLQLLTILLRYGTVIGSTFATMFPDKVDRFVLDGIVDPDKFYTSELSYASRE